MTKIFYHAVILAKEVAKRDAYIAYMLILGKKRHVLRANTFQYEIDQFTGLVYFVLESIGSIALHKSQLY